MAYDKELPFEEWVNTLPASLQSDPLWKSAYYRLAMYLYDFVPTWKRRIAVGLEPQTLFVSCELRLANLVKREDGIFDLAISSMKKL